MSVPRHGREHQSPTRVDDSRYRTRKIGRVELDSAAPESDVYKRTGYDDRTRESAVTTRLKTGHDVKSPSVSPVVDHRLPTQRVRLKRDSSVDKSSEKRTPQSPGKTSIKSADSVLKRGVDKVDAKTVSKGQHRTLPSTPARNVSYAKEERKLDGRSSMPINRHDNAQTTYARNVKDKTDVPRVKSNPTSPKIQPKNDSKDRKRPSRTSREEIPLKEILSEKCRDERGPRDVIYRGEGHRRHDGSGVTVTFQMQENDYKHWDSEAKGISSPKKGYYPERIYDKAGEIIKGKHGGSSSVPTVHKHYLSPDGHPSMVEKSKSQYRLQNQSSTETSGLGETITSGFSSQESIASHYSSGRPATDTEKGAFYDQGIDLSEDTRVISDDRYNTFETEPIDSGRVKYSTSETHRANVSCSSPTKSRHTYSETSTKCNSPESLSRKRKVSSNTISDQPMLEGIKPGEVFLGPTEPFSNIRSPKTSVTSSPVASTKPKTLDLGSYNAGPNFDELFKQSQAMPMPQPTTMGLQVEQINSEWNKHNRASSIKSRSSHGSFRSRSGSTRRPRRFLAASESRWMKWGSDRRASFRRRLEKLEKPEPEVQPRASTPVKKARQEGLMFIHPDLENRYISEEDINYIQRHRQQRLQTYKVIEKAKKVPYQSEHNELNRLTVTELNVLTRYWEHRVFMRSRYVSILLSIGTIIIYLTSICSAHWISYPSPPETSTMDPLTTDMNHIAHEGLWYKCRPVFESNDNAETCDESAHRDKTVTDMWSGLWNFKCTQVFNSSSETQCIDSFPHFQNAVIGLMIFSAAFGFVAAVLAVCGVCTSPLPKKIYYFHSAGEIFFVCALSTTVALIIYPVAIAMDDSIQSHTYGSGYGLGWGGTAFFFAASFCMSLDELVRESSQNKCCRYLCWRRRNDRGEHPV